MSARARSTLVVAVLLLGLLGTLPASARQGEAQDGPFSPLVECIRERNHLAVLMLMDESGSLRRTDPDGDRVTAAHAAVHGLGRIAESDVTVEVALASFATDYRDASEQEYGEETRWRPVTAADVNDLVREADRFAERDSGLDTDYAAALLRASAVLARHRGDAVEGDRAIPCQLLLLFTDGDYDIEPRDTPGRRAHGVTKWYAPEFRLDESGAAEALEDWGRQHLCEPDGVMDGLRGGHVTLATIALETEISDADRTWLRALTTGRQAGVTCGQQPGTGAYVPATDLSSLLAAFDQVVNDIGGGAREQDGDPLGVCPRESCPEGTREFELTLAYDRFHLLGHTGAPPVYMEVRSPETTEPVVLEPQAGGEYRVGSATLRVAWLSPTDATITGDLPADDEGWVGTWSITYVDPTGEHPDAVAGAQLYLFGALSPELVGDPVLRRGEEGPLPVRVVDAVGTPRTPADFVQEARLSATVTDPVSGQAVELPVAGPDGAGRYEVTYAVPTDTEAAAVNLTLRLDILARTGVALPPRLRTYALAIHPPVTYPPVGPTDLRLSNVTGTQGEAVGTLTVTGAEENGGCVWFEGVSFQQVPRGAEGLGYRFEPDATDEAGCVAVQPGEQREVTLHVPVEVVASGPVEGLVRATLRSDADPQHLTAEVPFGFDLHRPVDQTTLWLVFALLMLAGILLPFAVLWASNWWTARFQPAGALRHARVPVRVEPTGQVVRTDPAGGASFELRPEDFTNLAAPMEPARTFDAAGFRFKPHVPLNPFAAPSGLARNDGGHALGSAGFHARNGHLEGRVPFSLARQWLFTPSVLPAGDDEDGAATEGTLHVFIPEGPAAPSLRAVVPEVGRSLPGQLEGFVHRARALEPPQPDPEEALPPGPADTTDGWQPPPRGVRPQGPGNDPSPPGTGEGTDGPQSPWQPPPRA